jgi:hypothetical protein
MAFKAVAQILPHSSRTPHRVAPPDIKGIEMATEMLLDLEVSRECDLEDCAREGLPHRNVLAERLAVARQAGPAVEAAFLACLGDYIGCCCQGTVPDADRYQALYGK